MTAILLSWKRLMIETELYCEWRDYYCEQLRMRIYGWWMSKTALDDVIRYEWPQ